MIQFLMPAGARPSLSAATPVAGRIAAGPAEHSSSFGSAAVSAVARLVDVGVVIGGRTVLDGVTLSIQPGTCTAVLGENGAGKSTLLRVMATLTSPDRGRVELFGSDSPRERAAARGRIGIVGHALMLYEDLTALENLEFFGRLHRVPNVRVRAGAVLDEMGLRGRSQSSVRSLSRGMAGRVAIARAMLHEPELLLLDEPFSGLDASAAGRVMESVRRMRARGCAVLMAAHGPGACLDMADRVVVLGNGRIRLDERVSDSTPGQIQAALAAELREARA